MFDLLTNAQLALDLVQSLAILFLGLAWLRTARAQREQARTIVILLALIQRITQPPSFDAIRARMENARDRPPRPNDQPDQ